MNKQFYELKTLRLTIYPEEEARAEELARQAMNNCQRLGSTSKFQKKEPRDKKLGYLGEMLWDRETKARGIEGYSKLDASGRSDEGDDWVNTKGLKVDTKARRWSYPPATGHYYPIVKENADNHPPHVYALFTIHSSFRTAWLLGGLTSIELKAIAEVKQVGESLGFCQAQKECYAIRNHQIMWDYEELFKQVKKLGRCDFEI